ncbi:hypothetical protein K449DRAFT_322897 [Hypoxylon sp. EC38]|nr:hypothetical protein K449DRAFT_322897 [Hypoxylon sp. EC38]
MSLLYIVPLISSTCSLYFAWDQYFFLTLLLKRDIQIHGNRLHIFYWQKFYSRGAIAVVGLISITSGASLTLLRDQTSLLQEKGSYNLYLAGGMLAICHLLSAPLMVPIAYTVRDGKKDIHKGTKALRRWLNIHLMRALTVDLACFVSCVLAVAKTLHP